MKAKFIKYILYTAIGIIIFILVVTIGNTIKINNSEAYSIAKKKILEENIIVEKIGKVESFGNFPSGSIKTVNGIEYAQLEMKVIGSQKELDIVVSMEKGSDEWILTDMFIND
ncbi:hypothetical protein [Flavobacterium sp. NRK F7]|uniref:hypothetical protein n=1 Tax=Flavobacterium sp. NRK F7 TaxID=2954930 RepID=UPI002091B24B|nr:hypothetical protein [Flavobacterium sp. NRK F7]MCO6164537.1 hypothetical protein [Flavobacterium sp. NRK F7]